MGMARPLRVDMGDGVYHVMTRGIDRNDIFRCDGDRLHWLGLMAEAQRRFRLRIFAYVLMDNHVHLIVQTPDANLSRAMQWLKVSYSMWFNAEYGRVGPLFQGRFKGVVVDSDGGWLLDLSFYVHLNPVRLKMYGLDKSGKKAESSGFIRPSPEEARARMAELRSFRWSSYRFYAGYVRSVPEWLDMAEILGRCPKREPLKFYREHAQSMVCGGHDPDFMESLKSGVALGASGFLERVRVLVGDPQRDVTSKKELKARVGWERLIQVAEEVRGEKWDVFSSRRGDVGTAVVFRLARKYCGMSLKEIGIAAGGVDYAAVSDRVRRHEKAGNVSEMERQMCSILNLET
jgi:putative transposase